MNQMLEYYEMKKMSASTWGTTRLRILGLVFITAALFVLFAPTSTGAQGDHVLPFIVRPVNVGSGPGDGAYHGSGPDSQAIDFDLPIGTLIYPTKPGVVIAAQYGWNDGYGHLVQVRHHDGTVSLYGHLRTIFVRVDQPVGRSTELGESGNSGNVRPHPSSSCPNCGDLLHFEVRNAEGTGGVDVQYLVNWNEGCPGCDDLYNGTASGVPREQLMVESFFYDSHTKQTTSSLALEVGRTYLLTLRGTFSYWSPNQWGNWLGDNSERTCWGVAEEFPLYPSPADFTGPVGSDPEYRFAQPIYPDACDDPPLEPRQTPSINFSIDSGASLNPFPPTVEAFNPKHSYQYLVGGNGSPLILMVRDSGVQDNYGQFLVWIELYQ
jgi:murein DD-endopeptidase MepM/ murein hydrolase activator NlpD